MSLPVSAGLAALFACLFVCLFAHGCYGPSPKHCHGTAEGVLPGAVGQKRLFCPTKSCFSGRGWAKVPVLPNGSVEYPASGPQNGLFWGTNGRFSGLGTPKGLFWGTGSRFWGTEAGGEGGGRSRKGQRGERDNGVTGQRGTGASGRPEKGHQGKGAPPPEYTRSGGYGAGDAGGSEEGPPRARLLPEA